HILQIDFFDVAVVDDGADDGAVAFEGDDGRVGGFADFLAERRGDGVVGGDLDGATRDRPERVAAADFAGQFGQFRGAAAGADDRGGYVGNVFERNGVDGGDDFVR